MSNNLEYCCNCGEPTGKAGKGEDSLYTDDGDGPFCYECWPDENKENPCGCCDRAGEYNGYGSGPLIFVCPKHCSCHD